MIIRGLFEDSVKLESGLAKLVSCFHLEQINLFEHLLVVALGYAPGYFELEHDASLVHLSKAFLEIKSLILARFVAQDQTKTRKLCASIRDNLFTFFRFGTSQINDCMHALQFTIEEVKLHLFELGESAHLLISFIQLSMAHKIALAIICR